MSRKVTAVLSSLLLFATVLPTALAGEAYDDWSINCMIRKDKFRYVLPQAMRNNDINMWIVIDKGRGTEPLFRDFGIATSNGNGLFVFTDRGDRIEKTQMGGHDDLAKRCGAYDIIGGRRGDLRSFVAERDPERIGCSSNLAIASGQSFTNVAPSNPPWPPGAVTIPPAAKMRGLVISPARSLALRPMMKSGGLPESKREVTPE